MEYLLTAAAEMKPTVAVMERRMEKVMRRSLAGPSTGRTRWRWRSVLEMVLEEEREESQDWELNTINPENTQSHDPPSLTLLPTKARTRLMVTM